MKINFATFYGEIDKLSVFTLKKNQMFIFLFQDTFVGTGRAQKRVDKDILHNEPECGITRHRQFAKRIIGGQKSKFAELPWQVSNFSSTLFQY